MLNMRKLLKNIDQPSDAKKSYVTLRKSRCDNAMEFFLSVFFSVLQHLI